MARSSRNGPRQAKIWDSITGSSLALTASGTFGGGKIDVVDARTVLRMLGHVLITRTGVTTASDKVSIALGIGIVSTDAATLGASALPDPGGEPEYPWLYWAEYDFNFPAALATSGAGSTDSVAGVVRDSFDIRSMRRMKPRESLVFVVQYTDTAGTPPMDVELSKTRVLFGLH